MPDFLQNINLLEDFSARVVVLDINFVNTLDSYIFASQFMDSKSDFTKCTLTQKFDEAIEVKSCVGDFAMLLNICLYISYKLLSLLSYWII